MRETPVILQKTDDICFGFGLDNTPVRGQIVSLGPATADEIISRHDLPHAVSEILGEALALAALAGSSLKFDGKIIIEIRKEYGREDTPLEFLVAEYSTQKTLRAMAKVNKEIYAKLDKKNPNLQDLFGNGFMLFTLEQTDANERYQGQIAFEGSDLSTVASEYFARSEQIPTKILLACENKNTRTSHKEWRAAGILIQKIAGDDTRGETDDVWHEASIKFDTLKRDELLDDNLSAGELLLRLYHENGVSGFSPVLLAAKCTCNRERLVKLISGFERVDIEHMIENDGNIHARCEFCNTEYVIKPEEF